MKSVNDSAAASSAARTVAAEDLQRGDYVAIAAEIVEFPSHLWSDTAHSLRPDELVRIAFRADGMPLKVKAICLPFILAKEPGGQARILDSRAHRLVRLGRDFAKRAWRAMKRGRGQDD
jgi:hypothetical protein